LARADLIKKLFSSYQSKDDKTFRLIAEEIISDERQKHHPVLANELNQILFNGLRSVNRTFSELEHHDPLPFDQDRRNPLVSIRQPDRRISDLVFSTSEKQGVKRIIDEFHAWEIFEENGLKPVQKILFCGPSGCGKTVTAEAISSELSLPLLYVKFDSVVSSLLGETAANLRKIFDYAVRGQWVIFFDEFDAIGRSRDDATEHGEIKRVINSFLQLLDGFNGRSLVIAATNFEQVLDPAIWRRFDEIVRFELPTPRVLTSLLQKKIFPFKFTKPQTSRLTRLLKGSSHADAERLCFDMKKFVLMNKLKIVDESAIEFALNALKYRRNILKKANPTESFPVVDRG